MIVSRAGRCVGRATSTVIALLLLGCASESVDSVAGLPLTNGSTLHETVASRDYVAVALVSAETCLACGGTLASWLSWSRENPDNFLLIFTDEPSDLQSPVLERLRIEPDAFVATNYPLSIIQPPSELLFVGGDLIYESALSTGSVESDLLTFLKRQPDFPPPDYSVDTLNLASEED